MFLAINTYIKTRKIPQKKLTLHFKKLEKKIWAPNIAEEREQ